jgi:hypothetical protein
MLIKIATIPNLGQAVPRRVPRTQLKQLSYSRNKGIVNRTMYSLFTKAPYTALRHHVRFTLVVLKFVLVLEEIGVGMARLPFKGLTDHLQSIRYGVDSRISSKTP